MRKSLMIFVLSILAHTVWAGNITEEQALRIAGKFFNSVAGMSKAPGQGAPAAIRLAHASDGYYAFNRGDRGGFVIVAADDRAAAEVLGYADKGAFSADSMPEAMRWWLGEYDRELRHAAAQAPAAGNGRVMRALPVYDEIAPLIQSRWDQNSPYNALCPVYMGVRCPTGCVATALSQIMYYYKYPERGTGSNSYDWGVNGQKVGTLSADFSQSTYDWNSMTDTYSSTSPQAAKDAVARLMYDVGVASNMQYAPEGSGAAGSLSLAALIENFGYDPSVNMLPRDFYTAEEWQEMLYGSLRAGHPVYYTGVTAASEGHAFIIDGYRDGYFHLNWGWSGMSDGYFLTTALSPYEHGTGGGSSGFNYNQEAAFNIRPAEQGSTASPLMYCFGKFSVTPANTTLWATVTVSGQFYSYSNSQYNLTIGMKVVDAGGNVTYVEAARTSTDYPAFSGYDSFEMPLGNFPQAAGTYKVYPAYRDNSTGTWHDMKTAVNQYPYLIAQTGSDGSIVFSYPADEASDLSATAPATASTPYATKPFQAKATVTNSGREYLGDIYLAMVTQGSNAIRAISDGVLVDVPRGESAGITFTMTAPAAAASYDIVVITEDGTPISERTAINVAQAPTGATRLTMASPLSMPDAANASADDISITADIECQGGFYGGELYAYMIPDNGSAQPTYITSSIYIGQGETKTVTFNGSIPGASVGDTYTVQVYSVSGSNLMPISNSANNRLRLTIGSLTGIEDARADDNGIHDISIYNLAGVCVMRQKGTVPDLSGLAPGVYIVKGDGETRQIVRE